MEKRFIARPTPTRARMGNLQTAAMFIPESPVITELQKASRACTACPLWESTKVLPASRRQKRPAA